MLDDLFAATAWPMDMVAPYSFFHITLTLAGTLAAAFLACRLARAKHPAETSVLFSCGLLLAIAEVYKQGFLYTVVYSHHYEWWFFPFQLCSIPMYLCLAYPFLKTDPRRGAAPHQGTLQPRKMARLRCVPATVPCQTAPPPSPAQRTVATFLQDFGLLGGIMALAVPDGFLHPYWTLTLHGFFWHFILLFLGLYCCLKRLTDLTLRGYRKILPLYLACCLIACTVNAFVQVTIYPADYADLFYINCAFPSEQPVFRQISLRLGNVWGHLAYIAASCAGAGLIHRICGWNRSDRSARGMRRKKTRSSS